VVGLRDWSFAWVIAGMAMLLMVWTGCRKPSVEVEEGVVPLPPGPGRVAATAGTKPTAPTNTLALTLEQACAVMDKHLENHGVSTKGRRCDRLIASNSMLRLDGYVFVEERNDGPVIKRDINACLWPMSDSEQWQVGYVDQIARPCERREEYCKQGAFRVVHELSLDACPGDQAHKMKAPERVLEGLVGTWVSNEEHPTTYERIAIDSKGQFSAWNKDEIVQEGTLTLLGSNRLAIKTDQGHGLDLSFELFNDTLHLANGLIVPAPDPESFLIVLNSSERVRRLGGVCYRLGDRPRDFPQMLSCSIEKKEDGLHFTVKLDELRTVRLYRHRSLWMDSVSLAERYQREASTSPVSK
jgi:hypothetical protein